eukprot:4160389-Prymnesium_polylepis.1
MLQLLAARPEQGSSQKKVDAFFSRAKNSSWAAGGPVAPQKKVDASGKLKPPHPQPSQTLLWSRG